MDGKQARFLHKLAELDAQMKAGHCRAAERSVDVLASMARGHPNAGVREQLTAIVTEMKARVDAMLEPRGRRSDKPSSSVRAVSGGLPTLGKGRR